MTKADPNAPTPSVWPAGAPHKTWAELDAESPQGAAAVDDKDAEILRLNAQLAGRSLDPSAPQVDPRDAEIARLKAEIAVREAQEAVPPVEVQAQVVDPRDAEIAELKAAIAAQQSAPVAADAESEPTPVLAPVNLTTTEPPGDAPAAG